MNKIGGPGHATGRVAVSEADVIHVYAFSVIGAEAQDLAEDTFALGGVNLRIRGRFGKFIEAGSLLGFKLFRCVGAALDYARSIGVVKVRYILLRRCNPSVSNEETGKVPGVFNGG